VGCPVRSRIAHPATEEIFQQVENAIEFPLAWKVLPLP
jgi:hypothetical protein